ncbi:hypothetical protein NLC35_00075 [Candidatus Aminicenantes bacterium AC-334-K16]|jgi:uncharacterized membrane protein (DUF106 family)|nr:hypothetical protein [Candidatus Aminicenantes bacterium AC-334-K16]
MWLFNQIITRFFDIIFWPFQWLHPWWAMVYISLLTGLFMLWVFRLTSNQAGIKDIKRRIKAHLLEIRLYKDNFGLTFKAQGNILLCNLKYIGYSVKPMLVMILPLVLILIQLNFRFAYRPLAPGERTIVKVKVQPGLDLLELPLTLTTTSGIVVETPPLRIEEVGEIDWRIKALQPGKHSLVVKIGEESSLTKEILVAPAATERLTRLSPLRPSARFLSSLLFPVEKPLPPETVLQEIEVIYPAGNFRLLGLSIHWIIVYFILAIAFGFALKRFVGVEI